MSNVQVMIIKNEKVYFASLHYSAVERMLGNGFKDINLLLSNLNPYYLDAGYMVIDLDRGEVYNRQIAFGRDICCVPLVWAD